MSSMCISDPFETAAVSDDQAAPGSLPPEVELIISALEAGSARHDNRRKHPRMRYRVAAEMRLFSDEPGTAPWRIYTRDSSARGLGFITRHRLPLGYGGAVRLLSPAGQVTTVNGTLFRCRDLGNDWFEGAIYFNREQWVFAAST